MPWDKVNNDVASGPLGAFKWLAIFLVGVTLLFGGIKWLTMPADKMVERIVLKNSFQYKEGMEQRAAILQANISEIDIMLQSNPENREALISQKRIINAQLKAITINN